jgi:hypothetical protein
VMNWKVMRSIGTYSTNWKRWEICTKFLSKKSEDKRSRHRQENNFKMYVKDNDCGCCYARFRYQRLRISAALFYVLSVATVEAATHAPWAACAVPHHFDSCVLLFLPRAQCSLSAHPVSGVLDIRESYVACENVNWIHLIQDWVQCSCADENEPSGSMKGGEISWLSERLLDSQKGFCCMESVVSRMRYSRLWRRVVLQIDTIISEDKYRPCF